MDFCALLAAAVCCNQKVILRRLFLGPAAAVAVSTGLLLCLPGYISYVILSHAIVQPLTVWFVFRPGSLRDFLRLWLNVYLVLIVAGGVQQWIRLQTGTGSAGLILFWGILAAALFAVWQCRQKVLCRVCLVELCLKGQTVTRKAFCDSGNLLRDPASGAAVSLPQPEKALAEIRRALKDGGVLIAPTFTHAGNSFSGMVKAFFMKLAGFPLHSRWTSEEYLRFLRQNGWAVRKSAALKASFPLTYAECVKSEV